MSRCLKTQIESQNARLHLRNMFEGIYQKYDTEFYRFEDDVVDLQNLMIVENRGFIQKLPDRGIDNPHQGEVDITICLDPEAGMISGDDEETAIHPIKGNQPKQIRKNIKLVPNKEGGVGKKSVLSKKNITKEKRADPKSSIAAILRIMKDEHLLRRKKQYILERDTIDDNDAHMIYKRLMARLKSLPNGPRR